MGIAWWVGLIGGFLAVRYLGVTKIVLKTALDLGSGGNLAFPAYVDENEAARRTRWVDWLNSMGRLY